MFIGLLTGLVNASSYTRCLSLSNGKCEIQTTLINLHPNEYSQELHYYPFTVKLDVLEVVILLMTYQINYVFQTKQDLNQRVFNMTVEINGSKTLKRHISCECNCKFYGRKCNLDQWWNNDKY